MGLPAHKFRGSDYMPLKLKRVIINHGISQVAMAAALKQKNGDPFSKPLFSFLLNWNNWPKGTAKELIVPQVEAYLRDQGVPQEELATIWEFEGNPEHLHQAQPVGAHMGKPAPKPTGFRRTPPEIEPVETEMLSPQAKRHFKLFRDPFQDDVTSTEDVFLDGDQKYISEGMYMTAKHGGFLAVVGESGSGKSTLRKLLVERLRDQPIRLIYPQTLDKSRLNSGHICTSIINDLAPGESVPSHTERQARKVMDVLMRSANADCSHVLMIEEAHDLSISTLKMLKRFYELENGFKKLLSIVLIGQPELKAKLDENRYPEAREVIRRIEIAELAPLSSNLESYIGLKFKRINVSPEDIFDKSAYDAIRVRLTKTRPGSRDSLSIMYPLIVQNLITKAMNRAVVIGVPKIDADLIKEI